MAEVQAGELGVGDCAPTVSGLSSAPSARSLAGTPDEGRYERYMVAALGTNINLDHCKRLAVRVFHAALNLPVAGGQDLSIKQGEYKECKPMNEEGSKMNLEVFCGGVGGAQSLLRQLPHGARDLECLD